MRPYSALMALGVFILFAAASAKAADLEVLRAQIPFTFKAGTATLPPGEYVFRFDGVELPGVLRVRGRDGRGGALVLTQQAEVPEGSGDQPKLVFEKDGSQYVLSQVINSASHFAIQVLKPRPGGKRERSEAPRTEGPSRALTGLDMAGPDLCLARIPSWPRWWLLSPAPYMASREVQGW